MQTRSATLAGRPPRHPDADKYFKEGLGSIFRQWTALELAVHHQWGGPSSAERAAALQKEILDLFAGPDKIYKDDVTIVLEDFLETNFNTICEDGSPDELGDLLVTMYRQCGEGDFTIATNALAREFVRHEMVSRSQGLEGGDAIDEDEEDEENGQGSAMETVNEDEMEEEEEEEAPPRVDADGWETVTKKGNGKRGGKKR